MQSVDIFILLLGLTVQVQMEAAGYSLQRDVVYLGC
jgi:hypothetical protein